MIKKKIALIIATVSVAVVLLLYFINFHSTFSKDHKTWAEFGAYLGGSLTPILGLITIYFTYSIIKTQIRENRQTEFKHIFQVMFPMIDQNKQLIHIRIFKEFRGIDSIRKMNKDIESLYYYLNRIDNTNKMGNFHKAFWSVIEDFNNTSNPLMKTIYNLLKVIDTVCIKEKRNIYSDLIRAQFNPDELKFILYNGIASKDFVSFKSKIEKYSLLKDLNGNSTIDPFLKKQYLDCAFEEKKKFPTSIKETIGKYEIEIRKII